MYKASGELTMQASQATTKIIYTIIAIILIAIFMPNFLLFLLGMSVFFMVSPVLLGIALVVYVFIRNYNIKAKEDKMHHDHDSKNNPDNVIDCQEYHVVEDDKKNTSSDNE